MKLAFEIISGALYLIATFDGNQAALNVTQDGYILREREITGTIGIDRKDYERVLNGELTLEQDDDGNILLKGNGTLKRVSLSFYKPVFLQGQPDPPHTAATPEGPEQEQEREAIQPQAPPQTTQEPEREPEQEQETTPAASGLVAAFGAAIRKFGATIRTFGSGVIGFVQFIGAVFFLIGFLFAILYPFFMLGSYAANRFYEDPKLIAWFFGHFLAWALFLAILSLIADLIAWYEFNKAADELLKEIERLLS